MSQLIACRNGHEYTTENTYIYKGVRFCRACRKTASSAYEKIRIRPYNPEGSLRHKLMYLYELTLEQYQKLHDAQKGLCAVCGSPETHLDKKTGEPQRLSVDHDHKTGEVRGLLCRSCNRALGFLKDNADLCMRLINYLRNPPAKAILNGRE